MWARGRGPSGRPRSIPHAPGGSAGHVHTTPAGLTGLVHCAPAHIASNGGFLTFSGVKSRSLITVKSTALANVPETEAKPSRPHAQETTCGHGQAGCADRGPASSAASLGPSAASPRRPRGQVSTVKARRPRPPPPPPPRLTMCPGAVQGLERRRVCVLSIEAATCLSDKFSKGNAIARRGSQWPKPGGTERAARTHRSRPRWEGRPQPCRPSLESLRRGRAPPRSSPARGTSGRVCLWRPQRHAGAMAPGFQNTPQRAGFLTEPGEHRAWS